MNDPLRHLPFALVVFIILLIGFVGIAVHVEWRALVTLLAPIFWLGLYLLAGANRAASRE